VRKADLTMTTAEREHEQQTGQIDRQLVASRYRLRARVGSGQLGEIYEADDDQHRDLAVERRVAIQLLPDGVTQDRGLFNKLKLGYAVLRAAPHPNVVPIMDFGHDGSFGYLVTDLLNGASMRAILDNATTLPLEEVIPVVRAVGEALQFLHAKSIVHGRLTTQNVFVTEDLEVRLLDVVPLDSTISILRGGASGNPFGRHDIADDIYGLACLAYEMLAGKHPFNFHALSEARRAGLKPARIDSLPEKQWSALSHALTFDSEQRTPTVGELLREFGVEGTERLRLSEDAMANHESSSSHLVNEALTTPHPGSSSSGGPVTTPVAPSAPAIPIARSEDALDPARAKGTLAGRMPSLILGLILVGLGVWYFYGQPRDDVFRLVDYVDSYLDDTSARKGDGGLPITESDTSPAASGNNDSANISSTFATRPEAQEDTRPELTDSSLAGEDTASSEDEVNAAEVATTEAADDPVVIAETTTPQLTDDATNDFTSTSNVDRSQQTDPQFTLERSIIHVSEGDGSARITNPLSANMVGQIFWWTADETAIAENDYIPVEEPRTGFSSGEESETLHVPLVNDSIPEPRETFYIYLGRHNPELGRLETIARISVEIADDDLR
jgi:serine/threonine protein kinase